MPVCAKISGQNPEPELSLFIERVLTEVDNDRIYFYNE
jgi:hypothetical protein